VLDNVHRQYHVLEIESFEDGKTGTETPRIIAYPDEPVSAEVIVELWFL